MFNGNMELLCKKIIHSSEKKRPNFPQKNISYYRRSMKYEEIDVVSNSILNQPKLLLLFHGDIKNRDKSA